MRKNISLSNPSISRMEFRYVRKALRSGWLTQFGSQVAEMENSISTFFQQRNEKKVFATSTSNGTTALHLALLSLNVGPGDEVIIPGFCYVAVANSVLYCGATPVIVDVELDTWNLDGNQALEAVTTKTRAVISVDNYGREGNIELLRGLLPEYVSIIQDSAESFPSNRLDDNASFADLTTISMYANKIITAGEGGAIVGGAELIEKIKKLKNQSQDPKKKFSHNEIGYNYRITNLQSAIFNAQWKRKEKLLRSRRRVFSNYKEALERKGIRYSMNVGVNDSPWLLTLRLLDSNIDVNSVMSRMLDSGIETRPGFTAMQNMPYISQVSRIIGENFNSDLLSKSVISLPTYPGLTWREINFIVDQLAKAISIDG